VPFQDHSSTIRRKSDLSELEDLISQTSRTGNNRITGQPGFTHTVEDIETICNCRQIVAQRSKRAIFSVIEVSSQIAISHRQDCPYARNQKSTKKLGLQIFHISQLVGTAIKGSVSMQFGAGDFSISPYLSLRGFSRRDSPAFELFDELKWDGAKTLSQYISIMRQLPTRLLLLFTDGKASPNEKNEFGQTLFHVSLRHFCALKPTLIAT
jgi:hypothetical protein